MYKNNACVCWCRRLLSIFFSCYKHTFICILWMFTDEDVRRHLIFWCSGITERWAKHEAVISSCFDNGAPVVMGTEECERKRRRRRKEEGE